MKILFLSDGSSKAEKSMRFGAQIAAACQAEPSILGIAEKPGDEGALRETLRQSQEIFTKHDLEVQLITQVGKPVREIVKHCKETSYDLVVVGAAPKSNIWRLFDPMWMSVRVYKILESIEFPVLVVIGEPPALRRILLCTSGDAFIEKAIKIAGNIAQCVKAVVDLFHVMPDTPVIYGDLIQVEQDLERVLESNSELGRALRHQKEQLEEFGVYGGIRLRQGDVVTELLKELRQNNYDLVVAGSSPAEDSLTRFVMSDVTREIVNRTMLPVLVIRTKQRRVIHFFKGVLSRLFGRSHQTSAN
jgi:nucleotide-binding universal stress UspA family protein